MEPLEEGVKQMSLGVSGEDHREEPLQTHIPLTEPESVSTEELLARHLPCPLAELSPLNMAVMRNQATINIGTIGHVAHGKTTAVKAISGVHTIKHSHEKIRNITIKLGYANAKIYKCTNPACPRPLCYKSYGSGKEDNPLCLRPGCGFRMQLVRHVSFIDCPGHEILTATMLTGSAVMDAALLLIAANEPCPQPQTKEHLAAVEVMKLSKVLILQNKLDLLKDEEAAKEHHRQILEFVKGTVADGSPVIPMSAQLGYNIDILLELMVTKVPGGGWKRWTCAYMDHIPIPTRNFTAPPRLIVIRSFDVNKPGTDAMELQGGVAGGSLLEGVLVVCGVTVGQEIELRPGYISRDHTDKYRATPIFSRIVSLKAEENNIDFAVPGGLIGVGTMLDPSLCRADNFVGQVLGAVGRLPEVYGELEATCFLMRRVLGTKTEGSERQARVAKLERGETLQLNIGSQSTPGKVINVRSVVSKDGAKTDLCTLQLSKPVCTILGDKIAFSRKIDRKWRLIGWGEIQQGALLKR